MDDVGRKREFRKSAIPIRKNATSQREALTILRSA